MRARTRLSLALIASTTLLVGACSKSTPQVQSSATTAKADANKASGGGGSGSGGDAGKGSSQGDGSNGGGGGSNGGNGDGGGGGNGSGGNGGGGGETITIDALVSQWERIAGEKGLDADTTKCVSDNLRKLAPANDLTTQQANNIQTEATQICAQQEQQRHEIIVGNGNQGPTTTF